MMKQAMPRRYRAIAASSVVVLAGLAALGSAEAPYQGDYSSAGQYAAPVPQTPATFSASAACQAGMQLRNLSDIERQYLRRTDGVFIEQVVPGSRAALAGLARNDIVLAIDSASMTSAEQVVQRVHNCLPGQTMLVRIMRGAAEFQATLTF